MISLHLLCYSYFLSLFVFFLYMSSPTTEIYTLSLHDALPISSSRIHFRQCGSASAPSRSSPRRSRSCGSGSSTRRSEEHTSELQSRGHLVCRLLLEKKKRR